MRRRMLKSKIHRAVVTDANLHYVGSVTIDPDLLEAADILEHEQVAVVDIDNGARLETYAIAGVRGSGDMCLNGAAARLVQPGDRVIVISYADYDDAELEGHVPRVVHVDTANRQVDAVTAELLAAGPRAPRPTATSRSRQLGPDRPDPGADLDLLVLGSGVAGLSAAVGPPTSTACGSACSPRPSSTRPPPGGPRAAWPPCWAATPTRPTSTWPTRWPPGPACATSTPCGCWSTRARPGSTS